jgi:hypothetical protein
MSRRKRWISAWSCRGKAQACSHGARLRSTFEWFIGKGEIFTNCKFHGNVAWKPAQLAAQAICWAWQETRNVTDAFNHALDICAELGLDRVAHNYPAFMQALTRYQACIGACLNRRLKVLMEEVAGPIWRNKGWVLIGFDGSRATTPRTVSNERAFCAPNYGKGKTARHRKKKTKGMRRTRNEKNKPQPQGPQVWITMMWHMSTRLPWAWRLGPSQSSERAHVMEMVEQEELPKNTLFCGDAGFVGYPLWSSILAAGRDFLVRVGANVKLLGPHVRKTREGKVLCWPKGLQRSGAPPLELRLVKVKIGKTTMWMLTSVLDPKRLSKKKIVQYYKARWGIEIEFRGLKQTLDNQKLRCRNSARALVELDWSIRAMAVAELLALREQLRAAQQRRTRRAAYDPQDRSLANTMRAIRDCMRHLHKIPQAGDELSVRLANATVQKYQRRVGKKARYLRPNPDKKPLGEPVIRKLNPQEQLRLKNLLKTKAA